ncbi:Appr-1-p processing protein, partial [Planctomycetota bacterium]
LKVVIFEPGGAPAGAMANRSKEVPKMTPGRAALVGLMHRYLSGLLDPFVTLLEVHKLMYFLQAANEPLRLTFTKGSYGPYAENLRHVLNAIEGHLVSGYADGGDAPDKQIKLVPGAIEDAQAFLQSDADTQARFGRVADLVEGFESPFGLELLATVHWVVSQEQAQTLDDVMAKTYAWDERKKQFSQRQISLAVEALTRKQWMTEVCVPDKV